MPKTAADWAHRTNLKNNGMPRLPIFFCLDTSGSMNDIIGGNYVPTGEYRIIDGERRAMVKGDNLVTRLDELKRGLEMLYEKLCSDYLTKYSVEISIITFDDLARCHLEISNLADVNIVSAKNLFTHDNTCMGEGINIALDILVECQRLYQEYDVDYYVPWLIVMSDGVPNGREAEMQRAIIRIRDMIANSKLMVSAIGVGKQADRRAFSRLVPYEQILMLQDLDMNQLFDDMIRQTRMKTVVLPADYTAEIVEQINTQDVDSIDTNTTYGVSLDYSAINHATKIKKVKIMFAGSNPREDNFIRLDVETRAIQDEISKTRYRDNLEFFSQMGMRANDLQDCLRKNTPDIIHFSGHGAYNGELEFESDEPNKPITITPEVIAETIRLAPNNLKLAFFNACHSIKVAQAAVQYINVAIGMEGEINDKAAKVFSSTFYAVLGDGLSVIQAYEQALNALNLNKIEGSNKPRLFVKSGVDPSELIFTK